jgi:plasmid stabilization system protein ParE
MGNDAGAGTVAGRRLGRSGSRQDHRRLAPPGMIRARFSRRAARDLDEISGYIAADNPERSLCTAISDSIWGQMRCSHAAKSRPRILPTRRWTTRGGGTLNTTRCEKSASLVTMARSNEARSRGQFRTFVDLRPCWRRSGCLECPNAATASTCSRGSTNTCNFLK